MQLVWGGSGAYRQYPISCRSVLQRWVGFALIKNFVY